MIIVIITIISVVMIIIIIVLVGAAVAAVVDVVAEVGSKDNSVLVRRKENECACDAKDHNKCTPQLTFGTNGLVEQLQFLVVLVWFGFLSLCFPMIRWLSLLSLRTYSYSYRDIDISVLYSIMI